MQHKPQHFTHTRPGPRPILLHLQNIAQYWLMERNDWQGYMRTLHGLSRYYTATCNTQRTTLETIAWQKNEVKVYGEISQSAPNILLIPSLINGSEIFDLLPEHSLMSYLKSQGLNPLLLDWGAAKDTNIQTYINDYLSAAIKDLSLKTDKLGIMGYCMGGTLGIAALQKVGSDIPCVMLAAPWDFSKESHHTLQQIEKLAHTTHSLSGIMPVDYIQGFFAALKPDVTAQKYYRFSALQEDDQAYKVFVAVEDWLNNSKPLPNALVQDLIESWYQKNNIMEQPQQIENPCFIVAPKHDHIVAPSNAKGILENAKHTNVLEPDIGHIGIMASERAIDLVWIPMTSWLKKYLM